MLGRLARWLRVLGYDATWDVNLPDAALAKQAALEDRVLLTCDRRLAEGRRVARCLVLRPCDPLDQLRRVVDHFGLDVNRPLFARCTECNTPVEPVEKRAVAGCVPERTFREQERFTRCPGCGRVYWEGGHARRMRRTLALALGGVAAAPTGGHRIA
jgi:uncharacterized protein with PIN domain